MVGFLELSVGFDLFYRGFGIEVFRLEYNGVWEEVVLVSGLFFSFFGI